MKHFSNINSLNDLKDQYRKLALANHPDKGGDTKTMQEINAEYDILFPVWKDKVKDTSNETAQSTRSEFYTEYGWKGENYNINLRMTDITKIVRDYVKEKYPIYKFSIRTPDVYSLDISLMEAPQEVFNHDKLSEYEKKANYIQVSRRNIGEDERMTELCREILIDVRQFAQTYNFDDSDSMIDYFHTNFYLELSVGKWDKPFKVAQKTARIKNEKQGENSPEQKDLNLQIVDYSEKAIAVYGDTYEIKDELKSLGGRYNRNLKDGAGWVFSKSQKNEVEKLVNKSNNTEL